MHKLVKYFIYFAAIVFFLTGTAKLLTIRESTKYLDNLDFLLPLTHRTLFALTAGLELGASAFLLFGKSKKVKLILIVWLTTIFLIYRFGLWFTWSPQFCNCLGDPSNYLGVSAAFLNKVTFLILILLLSGSCGLLIFDKVNQFKSIPKLDTLSEDGITSLQRLKRLLRGWAVSAVLLVSIVTAFHIERSSKLPAHFEKIVNEISSVGAFRLAPIVNSEESQLLYARNMENGVGIYLVDLTTSQSKQLSLIVTVERAYFDMFNLYGWSADDKYLAFSTTVSPVFPNQEIVICNGKTGEQIKTYTAVESIRRGIWLSTNSIVLLGRSHRLYLLNIESDKRFGEFGQEGIQLLKQLNDKASEDISSYGLTRLSSEEVAYISDTNIFSFDVRKNQDHRWTYFTNNSSTIEWPAFNSAHDKILFCSKDRRDERLLYQFDVRTANLNRLTSHYTFKGEWVDDDKGIVYVGTTNNSNFLAVELENGFRTNLFFGGHILSYNIAPKGDAIFAIASLGAEPLGIWEYTITDGKLNNILAGTDRPLLFGHIIAPINETVTNKNGKKIDYYVLTPKNVIKNKKYPLMIDQPQDSRWNAGSQIVANSDIFYAAINENGLASFEVPNVTADDVLLVYQQLLKNPNVDTNRIYLGGLSWGTAFACQIAEKDPKLWRGLILFSPIAFPKISYGNTKFPSVFASIGKQDFPERLKAAQEFEVKACRNMLPTEIIYSDNAAHKFEKNILVKERYEGVVKFIDDGY